MSSDMQQSMAEAATIFDANLGDLPRLMAKILRAGIETGPNAPLVAAWCSEHPAEAARIVGAVAMVAAYKLNAPVRHQ